MPAASGDDLDRVLAEIAGREDCRLLPPAGQAQVPAGLLVPPDLRRFHDRCGGAVLFLGAEFAWHVSGPDRLVPASPRLLNPETAARVAVENPDDLVDLAGDACNARAAWFGEFTTEAHVVVSGTWPPGYDPDGPEDLTGDHLDVSDHAVLEQHFPRLAAFRRDHPELRLPELR
jgi:hypothetical protein